MDTPAHPSSRLHRLLGRILAGYIRIVGKTTRWVIAPEDYAAVLREHQPCILAMWHGQHFLVPYFRPDGADMCVMISRHGDGEINAVAVQHFGIRTIRGSGGHGQAGKTRKRKGAEALRNLLRALKGGTTAVLTADVPKVAGVAGEGIILLAKLSGRPILPIAVATRHHKDLASWDKASLPLPFGKGALVVGAALHVPPDADAETLENLRFDLQNRLNAMHVQAYASAGCAPWSPRYG